MTVTHLHTMEVTLTDKGFKEWKLVLATIFSFIKFAANELRGKKSFSLFDETRLMNALSFKFYKVPEQFDNVQALAGEMCLFGVYPERTPRLLKDTFSED